MGLRYNWYCTTNLVIKRPTRLGVGQVSRVHLCIPRACDCYLEILIGLGKTNGAVPNTTRRHANRLMGIVVKEESDERSCNSIGS